MRFARGGNTQAIFRLSDVGLTGPAYLYDYFRGSGSLVQPDELLNLDVTGFRYQVAAPIGRMMRERNEAAWLFWRKAARQSPLARFALELQRL